MRLPMRRREPGGVSWLQSLRPVLRVAELTSLVMICPPAITTGSASTAAS